MKTCEACPNNISNKRRFSIGPGEAEIAMCPAGVKLVILSAEQTKIMAADISNNVIADDHPYLVTRLEACDRPAEEKIPRQGILGKLGLQKTVKVCQPLARDIDARDAESVESYFMSSTYEATGFSPETA